MNLLKGCGYIMRSDLENIKRHIKTHTIRSDEDRSAVTTLKNFLRSNGKINPDFSENDKWPNTDGTFEFVENPSVTRQPSQSFTVQIKGTQVYDDDGDIIKYQLKSLGFPAFIFDEVTLDPGILFVVLNPTQRGRERVFWKYMSDEFLASINFANDSKVIHFKEEDEIKNSEESIDAFCKKLEGITNNHSFVKKLDNRNFTEKEIVKIISARNEDLMEAIGKMEHENFTRDDISRKMLTYLEDLCRSAMLLYAISLGFENPDLRLAWDLCLMKRETNYLCTFLRGLRYVGGRIPEDGQSERLMLKYYNFLWQIRKSLKEKFDISILENLEKFPLNIDQIDTEYYKNLSNVIESKDNVVSPLSTSRFYVQKTTPFFVGKERYYEITLQLSELYSTKYNRITVYSKENIESSYSVQIGYTDLAINLWGVNSSIKVVTSWKVSIAPKSLNTIGKMLRRNLKISSKHGEYINLMSFLTESGMNLLNLIDMGEIQFKSSLSKIYDNANTQYFKDILLEIHEKYKVDSSIPGKYTIRYLLINLREEALNGVLPENNQNSGVLMNSPLHLTSKCYPFEKNPYLANLVGRRTDSLSNLTNIHHITGPNAYEECLPYVHLKNLINSTGELYFKLEDVTSKTRINVYNSSLDKWQRDNGLEIKEDNGYITVKSFEHKTIYLLKKLLDLSQRSNRGQSELNKKYVRDHNHEIDDSQKEHALTEMFVDSQVALIYGAAGTGKTYLMDHISSMMNNKKKLFLTKTHTTLQNLKRNIKNPGQDADFISIDRFTKRIYPENYDLIFIDECSIIDNDTMIRFINRITNDSFLVLAGDIFQIESINFGNWFSYAKDILISKGSSFELSNPWRTKDTTLINLWNSVRTKSKIITEELAIDGEFSEDIGENIFNRSEEDEVILCLNYDGKFGLNNINQYFQNANSSSEVFHWKEWSYKVGDPILFNDTKRFNFLYNNLKGRIVGISKKDTYIEFTIDIDRLLTEIDCISDKIDFVDIFEESTRIRFRVNDFDESKGDNDDDRVTTVVPFQIAYALSIHKAQGLEFDSVKVIIPSVNSEKITHGVFYTAITRAKKSLKIFWSSETMRDVVSGFYNEDTEQISLHKIREKLNKN